MNYTVCRFLVNIKRDRDHWLHVVISTKNVTNTPLG